MLDNIAISSHADFFVISPATPPTIDRQADGVSGTETPRFLHIAPASRPSAASTRNSGGGNGSIGETFISDLVFNVAHNLSKDINGIEFNFFSDIPHCNTTI
jgi:hypothetical protein